MNDAKARGILLLAQMSSRGNLLVPNYTKEVVNKGKAMDGIMGSLVMVQNQMMSNH